MKGKMHRGFQIFALARESRFVVKGVGEGIPCAFPSLFEAARHARTQPNCGRGLILICSYCHYTRDDQHYWNQIDEYLMEDSDLKRSHIVCEDCFEQQARDLGLSVSAATA
jgi:hypothetical protein